MCLHVFKHNPEPFVPILVRMEFRMSFQYGLVQAWYRNSAFVLREHTKKDYHHQSVPLGQGQTARVVVKELGKPFRLHLFAHSAKPPVPIFSRKECRIPFYDGLTQAR